MKFSLAVASVLKTTGGKLWNKPWGLPGTTKAAKKNRLDANRLDTKNRAALADAASREAPSSAPSLTSSKSSK